MSLSGLLIQQERKDPKRVYISGGFGQVSYGDTLRQVRQLSKLLALSIGISGRRSVGICTELPDYVVYTVWAAIFADISLVFLPRCQNPEGMRRAMKEASVETHSVHMELMDLMKQIIVYSSNIANTFLLKCQPD